MNTSRSKEPKRYSFRPGKNRPRDGSHAFGLYDPKYHKALGEMISLWPHVEEQMIDILRELIGSDFSLPARQIFKSVVSNEARRKMMLALLERSPANMNKDRFYDDAIAEFYSLNGRRNDYVHGIWSTHQETGRVSIAVESIDDFYFFESRYVPVTEIQTLTKEMDKFLGNLISHRRDMAQLMAAALAEQSSPDKPPRQPGDENKKRRRPRKKGQ